MNPFQYELIYRSNGAAVLSGAATMVDLFNSIIRDVEYYRTECGLDPGTFTVRIDRICEPCRGIGKVVKSSPKGKRVTQRECTLCRGDGRFTLADETASAQSYITQSNGRPGRKAILLEAARAVCAECRGPEAHYEQAVTPPDARMTDYHHICLDNQATGIMCLAKNIHSMIAKEEL